MGYPEVTLVLTCGACPEQYDAFIEGVQVGYLRLRHGYFCVECPDCYGAVVYDAEPVGDGVFTEDERDYHLRHAVAAILKWWSPPPEPETVSYVVAE